MGLVRKYGFYEGLEENINIFHMGAQNEQQAACNEP